MGALAHNRLGWKDIMNKEYVEEILKAYHAHPLVIPIIKRSGYSGDLKKAYKKLWLTLLYQGLFTDSSKFYSYDREMEEARRNLLIISEKLVTHIGTSFIADAKHVKEQKIWELMYTAFCLLNFLKETGVKDSSSEYRRALLYQGRQFIKNDRFPYTAHSGKYFDFIVASISSQYGLKYL